MLDDYHHDHFYQVRTTTTWMPTPSPSSVATPSPALSLPSSPTSFGLETAAATYSYNMATSSLIGAMGGVLGGGGAADAANTSFVNTAATTPTTIAPTTAPFMNDANGSSALAVIVIFFMGSCCAALYVRMFELFPTAAPPHQQTRSSSSSSPSHNQQRRDHRRMEKRSALIDQYLDVYEWPPDLFDEELGLPSRAGIIMTCNAALPSTSKGRSSGPPQQQQQHGSSRRGGNDHDDDNYNDDASASTESSSWDAEQYNDRLEVQHSRRQQHNQANHTSEHHEHAYQRDDNIGQDAKEQQPRLQQQLQHQQQELATRPVVDEIRKRDSIRQQQNRNNTTSIEESSPLDTRLATSRSSPINHSINNASCQIHSWDDRDETCAICWCLYQAHECICRSNNPACKHVYHKDCMKPWLLLHERCPVCRQVFLLVGAKAEATLVTASASIPEQNW